MGISGRMQYAPTRVREKPGRFHISAHGYTKNAPDFTLSNKDMPKSCPILDPNLWRGTFGGVCFCVPTRVYEKFGGFHISAPEYAKNTSGFRRKSPSRDILGRMQYALHGYTQNLPDFRPKPSAQDISGRMQYAPTQVRTKFGGFHISAHGYT